MPEVAEGGHPHAIAGVGGGGGHEILVGEGLVDADRVDRDVAGAGECVLVLRVGDQDGVDPVALVSLVCGVLQQFVDVGDVADDQELALQVGAEPFGVATQLMAADGHEHQSDGQPYQGELAEESVVGDGVDAGQQGGVDQRALEDVLPADGREGPGLVTVGTGEGEAEHPADGERSGHRDAAGGDDLLDEGPTVWVPEPQADGVGEERREEHCEGVHRDEVQFASKVPILAGVAGGGDALHHGLGWRALGAG